MSATTDKALEKAYDEGYRAGLAEVALEDELAARALRGDIERLTEAFEDFERGILDMADLKRVREEVGRC